MDIMPHSDESGMFHNPEALPLVDDVNELFRAYAFAAGVFQPDNLELPAIVVIGGSVDDRQRRAAVHLWQTISEDGVVVDAYVGGCSYVLTNEGVFDKRTNVALGQAATADLRLWLWHTKWDPAYSESLAANRKAL